MKGLLKKGFIISVGSALLLKGKVEKNVGKIFRQNKIDPDEAEKTAREFFDVLEKRYTNFVKKLSPCNRQIEKLKQRINKLEEEIIK